MKRILILALFGLMISCVFSQPFVEIEKIVAADRGGTNDFFGVDVDMDGDRAIVGAMYEDEDANGLNTRSGAGAAYIFEKDSNDNWIQAQKLVASDRAVDDWLGRSVAISGDYAIVGAYLEDHNENGMATVNNAGSAYIFERNSNGNWTQAAKIVAPDRDASDNFGLTVSISGGYTIVGTYLETEDTAGNNSLTRSGAAYIYERDGNGNWPFVQKLVPADRAFNDWFAYDVSISGIQALIGAPNEDEDATGGNSQGGAGSAYLFERNGNGTWIETQKIVPGDRASGDGFGFQVSIDGTYLVVGAQHEDEDINGGNTFLNAGSAYVFEKNGGGSWNQAAKLVASDRTGSDLFGAAVSIQGDLVVVGAYQEKEDTAGLNSLNDAGSAYMFQRDGGGNWTEVQKLVASDRGLGDQFGFAVANAGRYTLIGAYREDEDPNGGNTVSGAGSSYIFEACITTFGTQTVQACDSYTWLANGTTYTNSGTYTTTLTNAAGCDSVLTLNLTINTPNTGSESVTTCDSYTWPANGTTYTNSGTYTTTLTNAAGCDSVVTLNLTINTPNTGSESITTCNSYTWPANGTTYSSSGTYTTTLTNTAGCDSVVTLNLTINTPNTGSESVTTCNNYTWPANGTTYSSSGTYTATLTNAAGCDSVVTLTLTINTSTTGSESVTRCISFTWDANGTTYSSSGIYTATLTNAAGCDSVATLNLTINAPNTGSESVTTCNNYTWPANGTTYSSSGTYTATLTNAEGCDSVATLTLTINTPNTGSESVTTCDSYTWPANGTTYTNSGTYTATLTNTAGCDSVVTLTLTINNSNTGSESITTCDSYTWPANGTTYTNSGTYTATLTNTAGCDSVVTLTLTINTSNTSSESITTCDSYTWPTNGTTYTNSGTYTATLTNAAGCDSVVTLTLNLQTVTTTVTQVGATLTSDAISADYQWLTCPNMMEIQGETSATFVATSNGDYAVRVTENGCTDTSSCYTINTVGRPEEVGGMKLEVFPNPTSGTVHIDLGQVHSEMTLSIFDLQGRKVDTIQIQDQQVCIVELDGPAGIYLLELMGKEHAGHFRVVKQ